MSHCFPPFAPHIGIPFVAVPVALTEPNALCAHRQEFSSEFGTHNLSVRPLIHYSNTSGTAENSQAPRRTGVQRLWLIRFTPALLLRSIKVTLPTVFFYSYIIDFVTPIPFNWWRSILRDH